MACCTTRVADRHPEGLRLRAGTLNGNAVIRQGLDWLLANAAGDALPLVQFHDGGDAGPGPHVLPALSAPAARALRALLQLRQRGCVSRCALPRIPAGCCTTRRQRNSAARAGSSGMAATAAGVNPAATPGSCCWGADPFASDASYADLLRNSQVVFSAVREGRTLGAETRQEGSA